MVSGGCVCAVFLSLILVAVCGVLHGFGSELCIFMAFYTAIEGTLLSNGRKQAAFFEVLIKVLYLLLYPVMLTVFVCYELKFKEYDMLVPIFVIAGVVVLMLGAVSYFAYDPYRVDKRNRKKANSYIKEMEKAALKEVRLKEKALENYSGKTRRRHREKKCAKKRKKKDVRNGKHAKRSGKQHGRNQNRNSRQKNHWMVGKIRHKNEKKTESEVKEQMTENIAKDKNESAE